QLIQKRMDQAVRQADLTEQVARCEAVEGIGPLSACALVMAFLRGDFRNSDAFVAFLGLDVRVRDSGKQVQRRRLS
ncbi:MAG TPA: IS110 family transposase, partial [Alcanivorax sp.]|nr:IS110 family transposase [Alcanivorax sp.]